MEIEVALMANLRYSTSVNVKQELHEFTAYRNAALEEVFVLYEQQGSDTCAALRERLLNGLARAKPPLAPLVKFNCHHWPVQVKQ